ncbi:MAG TPA: hypothetical protein VM120_22940 [Bryobacteraceae bacterium]|nr:hypothetical protein [Bryobacteraceae bacterium]
MALRSVAGTSLRAGAQREIWLRARAEAGGSFFHDRMPLPGSSVVLFLAGVAMLVNWNSMAAPLGFVAAVGRRSSIPISSSGGRVNLTII